MYHLKRNSNRQYAFVDANLLIYLNCMKEEDERKPYEALYYDILSSFIVSIDLLVLDELIWISKKKYGVPYDITLDFIRNAVLPYVDVLQIDSRIMDTFFDVLIKYRMRPSDAIHAAVMLTHNIPIIISEDDDFDDLEGIKRIWLQ